MVRPIDFVDELDDPDRISNTRGSVEGMQGQLRALADDTATANLDEIAARRLADALGSVAAIEPPPVAPLDSLMTEAGRLLHRYDEPDSMLDSATEGLIAERAGADPEGLRPAMQSVLDAAAVTDSSAKDERVSVRDLAIDGVRLGVGNGFKKLTSGVIMGSPAVAIEAIGWVAERRSWLATLFRFLIGILTGT